MFVYEIPTGTNQTTSATPNTEVDALRMNVGTTRMLWLQSIRVVGKAAGLSTISGIAFRTKLFTTGSTAGTSITPTPVDPSNPAAASTAARDPTAGSGDGAIRNVIGCGAAGPGGWVAPNPESRIGLNSGSGDSLDVFSASGQASLNFELATSIME